MSSGPSWLPEPLQYSDFKGDWEKFIEKVYEIFENDFKKTRPQYKGFKVAYDSKMEDGKEKGYWHLTSELDQRTWHREMDLRRCERIPWPRPLIENSTDTLFVSVWPNKRGVDTRILLWIEPLDYLVVLKQSKNTIILLTAYCTDKEHTRVKLRKERENAIK